MTRLTIGRDTVVCMSLAGRPGTFGSRFHNHLYEALGLDYLYKAFTTTDLQAAIAGVRALGIRGCAISMPFKEACIPLLDELGPSARAIASVNTIVNEAGRLVGHNTDYNAVRSLLQQHAVPREVRFVLRGSGGMAKAVASALRDAGYRRGTIVARNQGAGRALAQACDYDFRDSLIGVKAELLINVTPIGMTGTAVAAELAFPRDLVEAADIVFDVVANPAETPLILAALQAGKRVITGTEVIALQALDQFELYTGLRPTAVQVQAAVRFATAL
ncbi:MAG: shikimate 5-dehydrogenase [Myxococcales bacterium]